MEQWLKFIGPLGIVLSLLFTGHFMPPPAQGIQYELTCPLGTAAANFGVTYDPGTGFYRQNFCIGPNGALTSPSVGATAPLTLTNPGGNSNPTLTLSAVSGQTSILRINQNSNSIPIISTDAGFTVTATGGVTTANGQVVLAGTLAANQGPFNQSAGVVGFGNTAGFGNGTGGTGVTTTTLGTGTGPATPQTIVNYLEVKIGSTNFWIPLAQ